jgi:hypothetical protein
MRSTPIFPHHCRHLEGRKRLIRVRKFSFCLVVALASWISAISALAQTAPSNGYSVSNSTVANNDIRLQAQNTGQLISSATNSIVDNSIGSTAPPTLVASSATSTVTKNIISDFDAICNGTADDSAAFASFNNWALANQSSYTQVKLYIPSGAHCVIASNAKVGSSSSIHFTFGIKNLLVSGYGATLTGKIQFHTANPGLHPTPGHSALVQTVSAGSSCVTLVTQSQTSMFGVGDWALMAGLEMQALWKSNYGYPPNWEYFDFVQVNSVNAATGQICFNQPLTYGYKSTWPTYSPLSVGAASLYQLDQRWNAVVEYDGLTIDQPYQTYGGGRSVTYRDVTFTGPFGPAPSQTLLFQEYNVQCAKCHMEADKEVTTMVLDNVNYHELMFQSSSINTFYLTNSNITSSLRGTPKKAIISNTMIANFIVGTLAYGRTDEVDCTNCVINALRPAGVTDGIEVSATMSNGVIQIPNGTRIRGIANNGSGNVRLTVDSTAGFTSGKSYYIACMPSGATYLKGAPRRVAIIDGTHMDLNVAYSSRQPYTGHGCVGYTPGGGAVRWAIPGANVFWSGIYPTEGRSFRITDVTQDAHNTYIHTSLSGGFPNLPHGKYGLGIKVSPAPRFTCTGCSGAYIKYNNLNDAPAGAPLMSFFKHTYTGSLGTNTRVPVNVWGTSPQITLNATSVYSGALTFNMVRDGIWRGILSDGTASTYGPAINVGSTSVPGARIITLAGATGMQIGDSIPSLPLYFWSVGLATAPWFSADASAACPGPNCPTVTVTIQTDQGIVIP